MASGNGSGGSNLLALGSAAVVAVYAAGYLRTKPAADELDRELHARPITRPIPHVEPVIHIDTTAATPATPTRVAVASKAAVDSPKTEKPAPSKPKPAADTAAAPPPADSTKTLTPPADSAQAPDRGPYKDGLYFGWGRSRHGDIQAGVEIKNGHIKSAFISECLTQYSCSWIAALPPQVAARQSPEVDYVSGATQSTNAFYFAVVQALAQAK